MTIKSEECMKKLSIILKTLIAGYIITVLALLVLAFCLYKFRVSGNVISIWIYVTYGLSALCGGLILGKGMQHSRLVWGVLYGIIYFLILCVVSIILSRGISSIDMSQMVKGAIVCILCGAIGGIVS